MWYSAPKVQNATIVLKAPSHSPPSMGRLWMARSQASPPWVSRRVAAIGDGVSWLTPCKLKAKPKRSLEPAKPEKMSLGEGRLCANAHSSVPAHHALYRNSLNAHSFQ